jgi:hypothetical protein
VFGLEIPIAAAIISGLLGASGGAGAAIYTARRTRQLTFTQEELKAVYAVIPEINALLNTILLSFKLWISPETPQRRAERAGKDVKESLGDLRDLWNTNTHLFTDDRLNSKFEEVYMSFLNNHREVEVVIDEPDHPAYEHALQEAREWLVAYTSREHSELNAQFNRIMGKAKVRRGSAEHRPMLAVE